MPDLKTRILDNIRRIMLNKQLKQSTVGAYAGISDSQFSKVLSGVVGLSFNQLEKIASGLNMPVIDIITYPDKYVLSNHRQDDEPVEAILQIKLRKGTKDQVLKLVFGDHDVEILNKK